MVTINKTAVQPYLQKAMLLGRHSLVLGLAVAKQFVAWLKTPAVQRTAFRNIALMIAGYLLMLCLFFLYSLSLNTPDTLPEPMAQQLQQQDVSLDALNEAVTRLEKKKALAKL
ncbi:hypothetical protein [Rheinheimera sp.]|uniref:hypothetical protein n=1 Tax=Rheinheimera sp. TaxID=1869214 RepID=UPI0027B9E156|nr:hypothetical protein [Rheinheimera sp.]